MNEKTSVAFYRYMAAHVNMNAANNIDENADILGMFALLKPPVTDFITWCQRVGEEISDSDEEKKLQGENFKNIVLGKSLNAREIKVDEEVEEDK